MDNPAWNDTQLVRASQQGDQRAFAALVNRYKGLVSGLAYSSTCDLPLSQDLSQEAFTVAWRKLSLLTDGEKFRPWICGILRHLVQDALRERQRNAARTRALDDAKRPAGSAPPSPAEAALAREQSETVSRALAQLPEELRLPLVLFYYEGHSSKAVAELLGVSDDAVRQRLVRGRDRLREEMMKLVDSTLDRQRPGRAFVIAVLARLGKVPAAPLTAAKTLFPAAAAKAVAAAALFVAGTLALWAFTPAERINAGSSTPPAPVQEEAPAPAAEVEVEPPAEIVASYLPPISTPPAPAPVAAASARDDDALAMAIQIVERAWGTQPSPAAQSLCVEAWGYLAALGKEEYRKKLVHEALNPASDGLSMRSCQMLAAVLYDKSFLDEVYRIISDPTINARLRLLHLGNLRWYSTFLTSQGDRIPDSVTDAAVDLVERYGPLPSPCVFIQDNPTERARPMAEYYLLASAQGSSAPKAGGGGGFGFATASDDLLGQPYEGACLADGCLAILGQIGGAESVPVVREYISYGGGIDVAFAAFVLCRLGDREYGLDILRRLLASTTDPYEQMRHREFLVKAGDQQHLAGIKDAMQSGDDYLRLEAYATLCKLNNDAFVRPAVRDFATCGENGFWRILRGSPEIYFQTESGMRLRYNEAFTAYCEALITSPDAFYPKDRAGASMVEQSLVGLSDSPCSPKVLESCLAALSVDGAQLDDLALQGAWVHKLVFLLHWGDAETRQLAAKAMADACGANDSVASQAVFKLKWAYNPEAKAPLVAIMQSSPDENHRVLAALAYLAIESGKRL